ncbi:mannose-6-phosphate isomerase, type 1 [Alteromonadaceae bacterium Bs31]|nr:mannose-6-phosphate isomerase, type 1 [Alteromonadaceae bacterium Bs31]
MAGIVKIEGKIQTYQWGGRDYLASLLSKKNDHQQAWAEYWLGTHPSAPSILATKAKEFLPDYIHKRALPELQFLLKVLDVKDILSIQVHPTREQALSGYEKENAAGIPANAKQRNYKDKSDKPELAVALSEFWLLHGFKSIDAISDALSTQPYLAPLHQHLKQNGLAKAFEMALDQSNPLVQQMHSALIDDLAGKHFKKTQIEFWIQRWVSRNPGINTGILTLYFLNLVKMNAGEAIYQPPGLLHAYMEGQNIELMANSDNVLRAGLTPKHIDVPELLRICQLQPTQPEDFYIKPHTLASGERIFNTPFKQFQLSVLESNLATEFQWQSNSLEILFCYQGCCELDAGNGNSYASQGQAFLLEPGTNIVLKGEDFCVYRSINTL